jgi:hypothetical protein
MDTELRLSRLENETRRQFAEVHRIDPAEVAGAAHRCFAAALIRYLAWQDTRLARLEKLAGVKPEDVGEP